MGERAQGGQGRQVEARQRPYDVRVLKCADWAATDTARPSQRSGKYEHNLVYLSLLAPAGALEWMAMVLIHVIGSASHAPRILANSALMAWH